MAAPRKQQLEQPFPDVVVIGMIPALSDSISMVNEPTICYPPGAPSRAVVASCLE